jgi:hypothetical protein
MNQKTKQQLETSLLNKDELIFLKEYTEAIRLISPTEEELERYYTSYNKYYSSLREDLISRYLASRDFIEYINKSTKEMLKS